MRQNCSGGAFETSPPGVVERSMLQRGRHTARPLCSLFLVVLLFGQVCQGQDDDNEEFASPDETTILGLATAACPPGSTPSLTNVCNTTRYPYAAGCTSIVIKKNCLQPVEGSDCVKKEVLLEKAFEGPSKQRHNITCLVKQKCGPFKNLPPLSVRCIPSLILWKQLPRLRRTKTLFSRDVPWINS